MDEPDSIPQPAPETQPEGPRTQGSWLAPYRWKKGQSGNKAGRPPNEKLLTEAYQWILEQQYPPGLKVKLEAMIGVPLPKKFTFAKAIALGRALSAVSDTGAAEAMANRVEGLLRQAIDMTATGPAPSTLVVFVGPNKAQPMPIVKNVDAETVTYIEPAPKSDEPSK